MLDIVKASVVNFMTCWGDKERNLARILQYSESEAQGGAKFIIFPEMALTGYDGEPDKPAKEQMQTRLAETIPGPATDKVAEISKKYGVYIVFGMPERSSEEPSVLYNSAAVLGPEGLIGGYRKIHIPIGEAFWANRGEDPLAFSTPWGLVGVSICYDTYFFPELMRYYRCRGARLILNPTAINQTHAVPLKPQRDLESVSFSNMIYIASSNLCGQEKVMRYYGGSSVIGPSCDGFNSHYYCGSGFWSDIKAHHEPGVVSATVDLTTCEINHNHMWKTNPVFGCPDVRPELYTKWYAELLDDPNWNSLITKNK